MNDLLDIETDRISHPNRALVTGVIPVRVAWLLTVLFAAIALTLAVTVSLPVLFLAITAALLLAVYNLSLKNLPLIGNFTIALLAGLTIITGAAAASPTMELALPNPIMPALFAFLIHSLRELVKDIEDIDGDRLVNARTLPIVAGIPASLKIVNVILALLIVSTLVPVFFRWYTNPWYLTLVLFLIDFPLIFLVVSCLRNPVPSRLKRLSLGLKLAMIVGMIALVIG